MPDLTKPHAQAPSAATHEPIFVDPSGRRRQQVLTVGVITVGFMSMYALVMLFALLGGSTVAAPPLPPRAEAGAGAETVALREQPSTNPSPAPLPREASTARKTPGPAAPQQRTSAPGSAAETSASAQRTESADPEGTEAQTSAEPTDPAPSTAVAQSAPGKSAAAPGRSDTKPSRATAKPTREARP
ncbi:hypothetical protein Q2T94_03770 [Paeniglutamicibacter sulfureus]|uniref:hypothetical protein n=1 Tax=Paeniglutamicibacter sulfureus TaxID=43666 RepID=UPI00266581B6|nr:hypothetical protein [Paeniglutamicibacter sulfureus]MDO2933427.1 hypothetical protein [Paeniglutamicibacter sulfureus]